MPTLASVRRENVASIARRVLAGCKNKERAGMQRELDQARRFTRDKHLDALEAERMEVLLGALESLECARPEQVKAALYLLRHLANTPCAEA